MAPGADILSTLPLNNNSYGNLSGTSMASPLVAGLCAFVSSYAPYLSPDQLEAVIKDNSFDIYPLISEGEL